jgi:hypothetical protein
MASLHWYQIGTSVPKHKVDKVQIVTYQVTMAKDKATEANRQQDSMVSQQQASFTSRQEFLVGKIG